MKYKIVAVLAASLAAGVLASCGSSATNEEPQTPATPYDLETGYIETANHFEADGKTVDGFEFDSLNGKIVLQIDKGRTDDGMRVYPADAFIDGSAYEDMAAGALGWPSLGAVVASGIDGAGEKFAVADIRGKLDDYDHHQDIQKDMTLVFTDMSYYYSYVSDDGVEEVYDRGIFVIGGGQVTGTFKDVTVTGVLDGKTIKDGKAVLTLADGEYEGEAKGLAFYDAEWNGGVTGGGFVSSDPNDAVQYAGGWSGTSKQN